MCEMYQGIDRIINFRIDFLKGIVVVELSNGKRYYKELVMFKELKDYIQDVAAMGFKYYEE